MPRITPEPVSAPETKTYTIQLNVDLAARLESECQRLRRTDGQPSSAEYVIAWHLHHVLPANPRRERAKKGKAEAGAPKAKQAAA